VLHAHGAFAAAFAIQGTSVPYPQVSNAYLPFFGYYPLRRGPGSRCCAATPPWPCSWLPSCCAAGTHESLLAATMTLRAWIARRPGRRSA